MAGRKNPKSIAERNLLDESGGSVKVTLGRPEQVSPTEWQCAFRVEQKPRDAFRLAHGIDAFQALMNALEGIRVTLGQMGGSLTWEGGESAGDTGFPRFVPAFYGVGFSKTIESMIESEVQRFAAAQTKKR